MAALFTPRWLIAACLVIISSGFKRPDKKPSSGEKMIDPFSLNDIYGNRFSLEDYKTEKGCIVIFTCSHCPFANLYHDRLNKINKKYSKAGFPLLAINPVSPLDFPEERVDELQKKAKANRYNFRYLIDSTQAIARNFGAVKTPHAFVLIRETRGWIIKYNGAIDDNGAHPEKVENAFVEKAVDELLSGKPLSVTETKSIGCKITITAK